MLRPYLKIWDWDWIFGRAVKAISSLGIRSPWSDPSLYFKQIISNYFPKFFIQLAPSSIYSCSIGHILEYVFCHLGCWAVKGKFLKRRNFCLSMQLFWVVFSCFHGQKFNFSKKNLHCSNRIKKLLYKKIKINFKKFGKKFFWVKNRLPLTIFWSEIVSVIHRGALKINCI